MFDEVVAAAAGACGGGVVGAWARVENAACAQRLFAIADVLEARMSADDSAEREQWCLDNIKCLCRKHRIHSRYEEATVKRCQSPGTPLSS
jgi:hypothetical protein